MGRATTATAELWGVKIGFELTWDQGFQEVVLEVDYLVVFHFSLFRISCQGGMVLSLRIFGLSSLEDGKLQFNTHTVRGMHVLIDLLILLIHFL